MSFFLLGLVTGASEIMHSKQERKMKKEIAQ